jgi:hypothetical protein
MRIVVGALAAVILLGIFLYTLSYGRWTWKKNNKIGAVMVFITAFFELILPVYTYFFRE